MRCLRRFFGWLGSLGSSPSKEATSAAVSARESEERAAADLMAAREARGEAEAVIHELRRHNSANRYDEWLINIAKGKEATQ